MSAFTVCWKKENRNAANDIHFIMSANTSEHFGAREISLASEVLHQQDSSRSCQKKTSNAPGVQNHVGNTFRQPNLSFFSYKEYWHIVLMRIFSYKLTFVPSTIFFLHLHSQELNKTLNEKANYKNKIKLFVYTELYVSVMKITQVLQTISR